MCILDLVSKVVYYRIMDLPIGSMGKSPFSLSVLQSILGRLMNHPLISAITALFSISTILMLLWSVKS